MAAYAAAVTSSMKRAVKIDQVTGFGVYFGEVDVTNYNTTLAEITGISGQFRQVLDVIVAPTDLGFLLEWVDASKAFKAWFFDYNAAGDGPAIEATTDTDVGAAKFVAFGLM